MYNNIIEISDPSLLREPINNSDESLWVGALSFEDRCIGSINVLHNKGLRIKEAFVLDYSTNVYPSIEDRDRRARNWELIKGAEGAVFNEEIVKQNIDPYSFQEFQNLFEKLLTKNKSQFIIFDISCITKIHTLALATILSTRRQNLNWAITYSIPENYGNPEDNIQTPGWRDVIIAPLAETALLFNELQSRGIIFPGHEADRLIIALAEIEPSGGIILVANTPKRPDLCHMSQKLNKKVIRMLTKMQSSDWEKIIVQISDFENLKKYVANEIKIACKNESPVILFPYGPKSFLFFAAIQLASEYPEASWFVYPIPSGYDVNYSEGIDKTIWILSKILFSTEK